ncbi:hypothetical protein GW17_00036504 [Ensete ventricosum]|nr:hypothetical protein GW17_00036504 [Ensete ventricosum]
MCAQSRPDPDQRSKNCCSGRRSVEEPCRLALWPIPLGAPSLFRSERWRSECFVRRKYEPSSRQIPFWIPLSREKVGMASTERPRGENTGVVTGPRLISNAWWKCVPMSSLPWPCKLGGHDA